jgi:hypothetical protein
VALGLLAGVALTASPAQAQAVDGPYYAMPSWDRKMAPFKRFVVLLNWDIEAVLDKETGLVWEKTPTGFATFWSNAVNTCTQHRATGNHYGWRLPSVHELASLIDPSAAAVATGLTLPPGHPFVIAPPTLNDVHWSATTNADNPSFAWFVNLRDGVVHDLGAKVGGPNGFVWCVRGGMNADRY